MYLLTHFGRGGAWSLSVLTNWGWYKGVLGNYMYLLFTHKGTYCLHTRVLTAHKQKVLTVHTQGYVLFTHKGTYCLHTRVLTVHTQGVLTVHTHKRYLLFTYTGTYFSHRRSEIGIFPCHSPVSAGNIHIQVSISVTWTGTV